MPDPISVGILVGSLREQSYNKKLAKALAHQASQWIRPVFISFDDLPLFNQDMEDRPTPAWKRFHEEIANSDAILFVTPEYNASIPGVLKNAIDIGSRPFGASAWWNKPAGVITASPSPRGGFGSNHHLRQVTASLNMPTMPHPELYIGNCESVFDRNGAVIDPEVQRKIVDFSSAFHEWIIANKKSEQKNKNETSRSLS